MYFVVFSLATFDLSQFEFASIMKTVRYFFLVVTPSDVTLVVEASDCLFSGQPELTLVLSTGLTQQFRVHTSTLWVGSQGSTEEQNVWLRTEKVQRKQKVSLGFKDCTWTIERQRSIEVAPWNNS